MSRKDKMCEDADCIESIFLSYINSKSLNKIFLFFEGKDDFKYYCPRISSLCCNCEFAKYDCRSKENVLRIYEMITNQSAEKDKYTNMFFVDSDFDDNSNVSKDIYITPTYSIENLYFTDKAIENMIKAEMGLSEHLLEDKLDFTVAFNYIKDFRNRIINDIIYGNACYALQIKKSYGKDSFRPNLVKIKKYDEIKKIKKFEDIINVVENFIMVSEDDIEKECNRIKSNPIKFIRGKYLLEKMPICINKIVEEANKSIKYTEHWFTKKRKMHLNTSESSIISDLSNYAETPSELVDYIKERVRMCR